MDINSIKVLHTINQYSDEIDSETILNKVNLPKDDFLEILVDLKHHNYIKYTQRGNIETTNKGKTFILSIILSWLSNNLLAIIALIVAILK